MSFTSSSMLDFVMLPGHSHKHAHMTVSKPLLRKSRTSFPGPGSHNLVFFESAYRHIYLVFVACWSSIACTISGSLERHAGDTRRDADTQHHTDSDVLLYGVEHLY